MAHTPERMCVVCRSHKPYNELIRVTVKDGVATVDEMDKNFARGAYICKSRECIKKAEKKNIIERHLKCDKNPDLYIKVVEMV